MWLKQCKTSGPSTKKHHNYVFIQICDIFFLFTALIKLVTSSSEKKVADLYQPSSQHISSAVGAHWNPWCEIWSQMWKLQKWIQFNSFCQQVDDLMLLKITKKIIQENAFEQKKKKPGLNLTLC